jgi:hypothetical protein
MATKTIALTEKQLRQIVKEEYAKITPKVIELKDAGDWGKHLENKIEFAKALKLKEAALTRQLAEVKAKRAKALSEIRTLRTK